MIIKGRSPTMRHVSRTHRVAFDWSLDWINLDPVIQIKYVDIKNHTADLLIKGSFTRDEWNNLLHLFHIMNHSTFSRSHFFQTESKVLWCRKDLKNVFRTIRRRWKRSQERWILCRIETSLLRGRTLKIRVNLRSREVTEQTNCPSASGDRRREIQMEVCLHALKKGHKEWQVKFIPSILNGMQVPPALGDRCEEHGIKSVQNFQDRNTSVPPASGDFLLSIQCITRCQCCDASLLNAQLTQKHWSFWCIRFPQAEGTRGIFTKELIYSVFVFRFLNSLWFNSCPEFSLFSDSVLPSFSHQFMTAP